MENLCSQTLWGDFPYYKRKIIEKKEFPNRVVISKYKRKWFKERSFLLLLNLTRIVTLRHPLLGIGTTRMHQGAYLHSLYMAHNNFIDHKGANQRGKIHNFTGENVIISGEAHIFGGTIIAQMGFDVFNFYMRSSSALLIGWMLSKGHRENIMHRKYFFTGVGFCKKVTIEFIYNTEGKLIDRKRAVDVFGTQVFR